MILPSARAMWLWGGASLLFLTAWVEHRLAWIGAGADVLILVAVVIDGLRARRAQVALVRTAPPTVYQGEASTFTWRLRNHGDVAVRVRVRDVLPAALADASVDLDYALPAHTEVTHVEVLTPRARAQVSLTLAAGRVLGPAGLAWTERRLGEPVHVKVYPRVHHDGDAGIAIRAALERTAGSHLRNTTGPSTEVASLRDYLPGDDYRGIQWKATARRGKPVTAERAIEQRQRLAVLIDAGRPMAGADGAWTKLDHAMAASIALARVASAWGDDVTLVLFSRTVRKVVRTTRTRDFPHVFEALYQEQADGLEPDWDGLVGWCATGLPRRTFTVVCTSLVDPGTTERLSRALTALARRHRPLLVNLADPAIAAAAQTIPGDAAAAFAKVTAMGIEEDTRALELRLRAAGVTSVSVPADRLTLGMLRGWMELKARG